MIKISNLLPRSIIVLGVFYYYLAAFAPIIGKKLLFPVFITALLFSIVLVINLLSTNRLSAQHYKLLIFIAAILVISYLFSWPNVSWIAIMGLPLLKTSTKEYVKVFFISSISLFISVIIMALLRYLPLVYFNFSGDPEIRYGFIKYSLGFDGPNQAALAYFSVLTSGLYTYGDNKKFLYSVFALTLLIGILTGSRTGMFIGLALVAFYLKSINKNHKQTYSKAPLLFIALTVLTILTTNILSDNTRANDLLTYRPALINSYLHSNYVPSAMGSVAVYNKAQYQTAPLDNHPVYVLARYGVIGFLLFMTLYTFGAAKVDDPKIKLILVFTLIYGLFEAFFDIAGKNFILPILLFTLFAKPTPRETYEQ